ncbi:hypothetical protein EXIGLDRAFT_626630, partial [Exidia glandulosa HHB12029]
VSSAAFSPDGILLALGCSDNSTYVYDVRFLEEDAPTPVARFRHDRKIGTERSYGVTCVEWAPSRGLMSSQCGYGLYTGGSDGAVRVWRTDVAAESPWNGLVIAQMDAGIGTFSIGDPCKGEKMLVV